MMGIFTLHINIKANIKIFKKIYFIASRTVTPLIKRRELLYHILL